MKRPERLAGRLAAALAGGAILATALTPSGSAGADSPLPLSPSGRISVLSANLGELLNGADIGEKLDVTHFAARVQAVFSALNARGPAVPNYAPDVVVLSEVTQESGAAAAQQLTARTGYTYRVAAAAAAGTNAWDAIDVPGTYPRVRRETAILYNDTTMTTASAAASSPLTYPQSQIPANQPTLTWETLRQSTVLLQERAGGRRYGIYSAHYRPYKFVTDHDVYTGGWTRFLKSRLSELYPGAVPVIAGDFNRLPCTNFSNAAWVGAGYSGNCTGAVSETPSAYWSAMTTNSVGSPGVYIPGRPTGVDNVFSTLPVLSSNYDYDYKTYGTGTSQFANGTAFAQCEALYNQGLGGSAAADAINGCAERYYSDHAFVWSIVGSK
ncbi:hypothetical protein [Mumia zhuanghuii]|uniref:Endonuclease/exonuclease/phosphatase domain-containing protein n=1 Tax=Mumia zhuanghuii TaxID=2585211 RepID=A0A5C4MYP3_9ACTN|nr:hypothetical protein [Mumia zhuanghuii]TNC41019.1 hypothetical protein FHE65_22845 [Mumia zhuanghuii]TNC49237.1 hypothetical protein FHE65_05810 [Mumia zhuanghuii]